MENYTINPITGAKEELRLTRMDGSSIDSKVEGVKAAPATHKPYSGFRSAFGAGALAIAAALGIVKEAPATPYQWGSGNPGVSEIGHMEQLDTALFVYFAGDIQNYGTIPDLDNISSQTIIARNGQPLDIYGIFINGSDTPTPYTSNPDGSVSFSYTVIPNGTYNLTIALNSNTDPGQLTLRAFTPYYVDGQPAEFDADTVFNPLTIVPEPSSLAFLAAGIALLGLRRKFKHDEIPDVNYKKPLSLSGNYNVKQLKE